MSNIELEKLPILIFLSILLSGLSVEQVMSYPQSEPGCSNCHGETSHYHKPNLINVYKTDDTTFQVTVRYLNKDLPYVIGAAIVGKGDTVYKRKFHTLKLPITFTVPEEGEYLIYVGGILNNYGLVYDSVYMETGVDFGVHILELSSSVICAGDSLYVNFFALGNFNDNTIFNVQLSDKDGTFQNSTKIGSFSDSTEGYIPCYIPYDFEPGSNYKIRIIPSSSDMSSGTFDLTILPALNTAIAGEVAITERKQYDYYIPSGNRNTFSWNVIGGEITYMTKDKNLISVLWDPENTGKGYVCITETNDAGCIDSVCLTVYISVDIEDLNSRFLITKIYPNPAENYINIKYQLDMRSNVEIKLIDMSGNAIIQSRRNNMEPGKHEKKFTIDYPSGSYLIVISNSRTTESLKFEIIK